MQIAAAFVIGSLKSSATFAGTEVPKYLPTVSFIFLGLVAGPGLAADLAMLASCTGPFWGFAPLRLRCHTNPEPESGILLAYHSFALRLAPSIAGSTFALATLD